MQNCNLILVLLTFVVYSANARPTFDVLYKIAGVLENELIADSHGPHRDPYRNHQPGYGPQSGSEYFLPHSHRRPVNTVYPAQYPSSYPSPYPTPYPAAYPSSHGPYHAARPQHGQYPPTNYIQNPYDEQYPGQLGSNSYGAVSGSNSYAYGSNTGYKRRGY